MLQDIVEHEHSQHGHSQHGHSRILFPDRECLDNYTSRRRNYTVHANREALFHKTLAFEDMENNKCCIINFDKQTFTSFLNVLMGYEDLTQAKALDVFPVVMKYDTLQLLINCVNVLKPFEMN